MSNLLKGEKIMKEKSIEELATECLKNNWDRWIEILKKYSRSMKK